jgi:hypothetical protein
MAQMYYPIFKFPPFKMFNISLENTEYGFILIEWLHT